MAFDTIRGRAVLYGGVSDTAGPFSDTWEFNDPTASFTTFGTGCASTTVLPTISSTTTPKLGQTFPLVIAGFLPKPQFGQLILGMSNTQWGFITLPFALDILGMSGCNLLVSPDVAGLIATNAQGVSTITLLVPSDPTLLGSTVYGQAWAPDPKANPLGVAMTNGFKAVVGF